MHKGITGIFFVPAVFIMLIGGGRDVNAYDGDVDFSAPYITLDPETGKLITVDPNQNPVPAAQPPQHQMAQTVPVAPATVRQPETTTAQISEPQAPPTSVNPIIAGAVIIFVAVVVAAVKRKHRLSSPQA